jgi:DUF971 family protein
VRSPPVPRTPMNVYPTKLERTGENQLLITWSDGERRTYGTRELRNACPCATCREKASQPEPVGLLPILSAAEAQPLKIAGMQPVGSYAYAISFTDGHDTGIYSMELLKGLGKVS